MSKVTSPVQAIAGNLFKTSTAQEHELGAKIITSDGREYRYCKAGGTALVAGKLQDGSVVVANHANVTVATAASIGAIAVTVTLGATAATANQYANGYMVVNDEAGQGYIYQISSNPAADSAANLELTLYNEDGLLEALTTSSQVTLVAHRYKSVVIHASTEASEPVGVAIVDIAAASYGWLQVTGLCSCLSDVTPATVGASVAASETTDGAITLGDGVLAVVGYAPLLTVSTEYSAVFLTIG